MFARFAILAFPNLVDGPIAGLEPRRASRDIGGNLRERPRNHHAGHAARHWRVAGPWSNGSGPLACSVQGCHVGHAGQEGRREPRRVKGIAPSLHVVLRPAVNVHGGNGCRQSSVARQEADCPLGRRNLPLPRSQRDKPFAGCRHSLPGPLTGKDARRPGSRFGSRRSQESQRGSGFAQPLQGFAAHCELAHDRRQVHCRLLENPGQRPAALHVLLLTQLVLRDGTIVLWFRGARLQTLLRGCVLVGLKGPHSHGEERHGAAQAILQARTSPCLAARLDGPLPGVAHAPGIFVLLAQHVLVQAGKLLLPFVGNLVPGRGSASALFFREIFQVGAGWLGQVRHVNPSAVLAPWRRRELRIPGQAGFPRSASSRRWSAPAAPGWPDEASVPFRGRWRRREAGRPG